MESTSSVVKELIGRWGLQGRGWGRALLPLVLEPLALVLYGGNSVANFGIYKDREL